MIKLLEMVRLDLLQNIYKKS